MYKILYLKVHIKNKVIPISCGNRDKLTQKIQWLGDVAIARFNPDLYNGFIDIGVVKEIHTIDGFELKLRKKIGETDLKNGDHIRVTTSLSSIN